jgi:3-keto-5-aminohexanoate cleavage enzyme
MFILLQDHAELVAKAVELAKAFHREVATPDDARRILGLKGKDKVKF